MVKIIAKGIVLLTVILAFGVSLFAVPMYINYQGLLTQDGVVINGTRDIKFRIFDAESGGNNILGRDITHNNVNIVDGVFNTDIGPFSSGDLTKINTYSDLWLEVELDSRKFRQRLTSVSFAFRAESAKTVDDNSITAQKIKDGAVTAEKIASGAVPSGIPRGVIVMWTGSIPPEGWALCDGTNGTPDLRNKFIIGSSNTYGIGSTGGSNNIFVAKSNMPPHAHSVAGNTGGQSNDHTHSGTTDPGGSKMTWVNYSWGGGTYLATAESPYHTHSFTTGGASHNHTHSLNLTSSSEGGGEPIQYLPPYYALAYIMKL